MSDQRSVFVLLALFLVSVGAGILHTEIDSSDVTGKLSKYVNYSGILEEDKKFTLESLTSDEGSWPGYDDDEKESSSEPVDFELPAVPNSTMTNATRDSRIITQTAAALGEYPYYVLLTVTTRTGTTVNCGGAILSESWVITAAQCVYSAAAIKVDGGLIDTTATALATSSGIATIHPGFKQNFLVHDIALVKLVSPFTLSSNVYPIKLVKKDYNPYEITIKTMGFGPASSTATSIGMALNYVELVHVSKANCKLQTKEIFVEYPHNTGCLSSSSNTKGFCIGDTGGPVVYTFATEVSVSLLGINSIYQGCPSSYPMAYTRIGPYIGWIKTYVKKLLSS